MKNKTTMMFLANFSILLIVFFYVYLQSSLYIGLIAILAAQMVWIFARLTVRNLSGLRFLLNPGAIAIFCFMLSTVYAGLQGYDNAQSTLFGVGVAILSLPFGILISKYWNI